VRVFTPAFEMPFAGHPVLGTAHVVRALGRAGDRLALELKGGLVEVRRGARPLDAEGARPPRTQAPSASPRRGWRPWSGWPAGSVHQPLWIDTGSEQLVLRWRRPSWVRALRPIRRCLTATAASRAAGEVMVHAWATLAPGRVLARFFSIENGALVEDPATGSACANLGGWHLATGAPLPLSLTVEQGEAVGRPSRLDLRVDGAGGVFVSGEVAEVGAGQLQLVTSAPRRAPEDRLPASPLQPTLSAAPGGWRTT